MRTSGILLADTKQQVLPCSQLYMHTPGSCTVTCMWLEASAGSSRLMLFAHIFGVLIINQLQILQIQMLYVNESGFVLWTFLCKLADLMDQATSDDNKGR